MKVLIVGAGLAGLRTAEALRANGFLGDIAIVGDEGYFPYNRPPLSKSALASGPIIHDLEFRRKASINDILWILDDGAVATDFSEGQVHLRSGRSESYDVLVAATGIRPRRLRIPGAEKSRYTLRNFVEAKELSRTLPSCTEIVIVGAGFIGCEVAATANAMGIHVTLVAADPEPMFRPLGREFGAAMRLRHEAHGVQFLMRAQISSFIGDSSARGVEFNDGSSVTADLVIEAIGSLPNTEWLDGADLDLSDGVLVDRSMRAYSSLEKPVFAVGDLSRYSFELFDQIPRRVEHWNLPTETGKRAGEAIADFCAGKVPSNKPVDFVPSFWSDQYEYNLQSFGLPGIADRTAVVEGDLASSCVVEYFRGEQLVGVVGVDSSSKLLAYRRQFTNQME